MPLPNFECEVTYLDSRNQITALEVLGVRRRALRGGTHTVLVILTNENARKVPQFGLNAIACLGIIQ